MPEPPPIQPPPIEPPPILFLPGATGDPDFWRPVADRLPAAWPKHLLGWPGAGGQPHHPRIGSFDDLIAETAARIEERADLVAQSMGGAVAVGVALRHPEKVRRLVLVATSGGIDVDTLGAADWRKSYQAEFPQAARWVTEDRIDHTDQLARLGQPALLVWGDADPISPIAVGRRLASALRGSRLVVVPGGTHALAREHPDLVAEHIAAHLATAQRAP